LPIADFQLAIGNRKSAMPSEVSDVRDSKFEIRDSRFRRGVGLVELMIALAISAALLTAVAMALDASFKAYRINQEQSSLTQRARLATHRVLTSIRQSDAHAPYTGALLANFALGQVINDSGIQMYDDASNLIVFRYDDPNDRLIMRTGGVDRTLLEGVTQFNVTIEPMRSATSIRTGGSYDLLARATILLTLRTNDSTSMNTETTGDQTVTISSSVMPRRNVW
jgi:prepilin-type N-terminal cleavage/methylation domain-containing protein